MQYGCRMFVVLLGYGRYGAETVEKRCVIVFEQNEYTTEPERKPVYHAIRIMVHYFLCQH